MQTKTIITIIVLIVIAVGVGFLGKGNSNTVAPDPNRPFPADISEEFQVHIDERHIGQTGVEIIVKQLIEDSRCPANVNCIWAGRVVLKIDAGFDGSIQEYTIESDKTLEIPGGKITLTGTLPDKFDKVIKLDEFSFAFNIQRQ